MNEITPLQRPRLVREAIPSSSRDAQAVGPGRLWMDLGAGSRLHLCDPRVPEAIDVIFEDWGCFSLKDGLTPGEQAATSGIAQTFAATADTWLTPLAVFLDYRGKLKITMAGARDPRTENLYIWPQDIMPRKMAGAVAFRQAIALGRYLDEGFSADPEVPIDRLANRLAMG